MEETIINIDQEYEQFLEIMQPHISQLKNREFAAICSAWIQRLNACKEHEKNLRNKYIVSLCYQLSKGILDKPFTEEPTDKELLPITEPTLSEVSSSEIECHVLDSEDTSNAKTTTESDGTLPLKQTSYYQQYPTPAMSEVKQLPEAYRNRTRNIISKFQEIKKQNNLLHHELRELKSSEDSAGEFQNKMNTSTVYMRLHDSNITLDSLKSRLKEVQDVRNALIDKVQNMQEFIDSMNDLKYQEIEEIQARHKLELINIKSCVKQATRQTYENKLKEQKQQYEVKIKELLDKNKTKDDIITEKDKIIQQKESVIVRLSGEMKDSKENLHSILKKLIDRPNDEQHNHLKIQNHILQKRLIKMEKAKIKVGKAYESKVASLQKERHLVECSFQIQLVRQRAQIVNDVAGECQIDTKKALEKLEAKYQDIVANMQATAIQRRLEDQMAVASILQAASGIRNDPYAYLTPIFPKRAPHLRRNKNRRPNSEVTTIYQGNKVFMKKNFNENVPDEGRYGDFDTLFEKVHVPQRDAQDKA